MAFAHLYSTAFTISIFTSSEISDSPAETKRGPGCHVDEVFNGVIQFMRAVQRNYGSRPARATVVISIYIIVNIQVPCPHDQIFPGTEKSKRGRDVLTPSDSLRHTLVPVHHAGGLVFHRTEAWVIACLS
jgi:hypothetical protein